MKVTATYTIKYSHYFRHKEPTAASPIVGIVNVGDKIIVYKASPVGWYETTEHDFISTKAFSKEHSMGPHIIVKEGTWPVFNMPTKEAYIIDYIEGGTSYSVISKTGHWYKIIAGALIGYVPESFTE